MSYQLSTFEAKRGFSKTVIKYRECMTYIDGAFDDIPHICQEMHTIAENAKKLIEESYTSSQWYDDAVKIIEMTNALSDYLKDTSSKTIQDIIDLMERFKGEDRRLALSLQERQNELGAKKGTIDDIDNKKISNPKKPADSQGTNEKTQDAGQKEETSQGTETTPTSEATQGPNAGNGSTVNVPGNIRQTGICGNSEPYDIKWDSGTGQNKLHGMWSESGKTSENGIATYNGNYIVACSTKFGKAGDQIDVNLKDGQVIHCIIGDAKGADATSEWGHELAMGKGTGVDIIEWCSYGGEEIELGSYRNVGVESITNNGSMI